MRKTYEKMPLNIAEMPFYACPDGESTVYVIVYLQYDSGAILCRAGVLYIL